MKTVILLRHAKSDWSDTTLRDFDRGLNNRGYRAAAVMGRWAGSHDIRADAIIASPATRVIETLGRFSEAHGGLPKPAFDLRLYLASPSTFAEVIAETNKTASRLLVVAHSPGIEEFILAAVRDDERSPLRAEVEIKFPTAALAMLDFDVDDWANLADDFAGRAALRTFVRPRDLDPSLGPDQR